jgi:uncharacterized repeat protein (TIGR03803 family)
MGLGVAGAALTFVAVFALGMAATPSAWAQTLTTLHQFTGYPDGANSYAGLVRDAAGNLYGTTASGGIYNQGTVFELQNTGKGYTRKILHSFTGENDGGAPETGLILADGRLYGSAVAGGNYSAGVCSTYGPGCGTVFELAVNAEGHWIARVLHTFSGGNDGANPLSSLIRDSSGNLYGTTRLGGTANLGTAFELKVNTVNGKTTYKETVLHSFTGGNDGEQPAAGLTHDADWNLYGTTLYGGSTNPNAGVVFELSKTSGKWKETLLYTFCQTGGDGCTDGTRPAAGLIMDSNGNLYGTAQYGGSGAGGYGAVFELIKQKTQYKESVLYSFQGGADGAGPAAALVLKGNSLYGTSIYGGDLKCINSQGFGGCGTVFKVSWKTINKKVVYKQTVLHSFIASDGSESHSSLIEDGSGNFYGTTSWDNNYAFGTVFELTP